jgi:hypothetical protein
MNFIYEKKKSISSDFCESIIHKFNKDSKLQYKGNIVTGIDTSIKNTNDLQIQNHLNDEEWKRIHEILYKELYDNIMIYLNDLNQHLSNNSDFCNNGQDFSFKIINSKTLMVDCFQIQKYDANEGKYIYHNDFHIDLNKNMFRVITYLWYLNDVVEGGETEFFGGHFKITPECGKIVLFPATWTYPHCALIPKSNDKYIITGWLYIYL